MLWFTEYYSGEGMELSGTGLTVRVKSALRKKTPFQELLLLETEDWGRMLVLDGAIQTTEKDEFIYHEMIVHPAAFTLTRQIERVLVIGGGDGGTVREVLKHNPIQIDMVEIDRDVVEFSKEHLPSISCSIDDERVNLIFEDGREFVKNRKEVYDLIVVDCSDPVGPSRVLYEESFYRDAAKALKPGGIFVTQSESPFAQKRIHLKIVEELSKVFKSVRPYLAFIPTYPSGMWSFTIASNELDPLKVPYSSLDNLYREFTKRNGELRYYNPKIHYGAFAIPNFVYREE